MPEPTTARRHRRPRKALVVVAVLGMAGGGLLAVGCAGSPGSADAIPVAAASFHDASPELQLLGDRHFAQLHGFDSLEAYRTRKGPVVASFVVSRRWEGGRAQVVIDVQEPSPFGKWAFLLLPQPERSDDIFVYLPSWRRVRRLSPLILEHPIFDLVSLGDVRPLAPGELVYRQTGSVEIAGVPCTLIDGRPRHGGLGFDRVELAIDPELGYALRSRYFRTGHEVRRVEIDPGDLRDFGGRKLPRTRRIYVDGAGEPTVLELVNVLVEPKLPARLFSRHALRAQRFPKF